MSGAVRLARRFAERAGLAPVAAGQLAVIVEERVANVVEHGGPHGGASIVLRLRPRQGAVRIAISDGGQAFDPRSATFDGPDHARGGGAGLALIASLCRIVSYRSRSGRNRLMLEMPLG